MPDYQKMYCVLFNAITDAIEEMGRNVDTAKERLILAQQLTEEIYIRTEERKEEL